MVTTTKFGNKLRAIALSYAVGWARENCSEKNNVPNKKSCFQYLFDNRYENVIGKAWCAAFLFMVIIRACNEFGIKCPFYFSLSSYSIVEQAKKLGIRVDGTPTPGCAFWYKTSTGGHTGLVYDLAIGGKVTIEGNSGDTLRCRGCPQNGVIVHGTNSKPRTDMEKLGAIYIHIEEIAGNAQVAANSGTPILASTGGNLLPMLLFGSLVGGLIYAKS